MEQPTRVTILISGSGTNLQALIDAQQSSKYVEPVSIVRVISNRRAAYGLERAKKVGISTEYHNLKAYKDRHPADDTGVAAARTEYDRDLAALILKDKPDLVVCAGWMHIFSDECLKPLEEKGVWVINLHPALPGQFNGANAIQRAHEKFMDGGLEKTGVMIHKVIRAVDEGEPLLVREIDLEHPRDDDLEALEQRIHETEWKAIVEGTNLAIERLWTERAGKT
ncbi:phosphoribosylglycinamide formyltransferase [Rhizodiscina lignyota]|uniref:Phosphoribosylglycinamide formyltransferase n=1 Tax=Rhizodiscina lignyota TaxID=1504668 RepID=A0A9P4IRJ1_9PEZI|nr:phosphoribosylglycinamide formyltransferase [Rhizodiscina lignyota]